MIKNLNLGLHKANHRDEMLMTLVQMEKEDGAAESTKHHLTDDLQMALGVQTGHDHALVSARSASSNHLQGQNWSPVMVTTKLGDHARFQCSDWG